MSFLMAVCLVTPSRAEDLGKAQIRNCTWCHGSSAQGYEPAPRLAGQQRQYIVNQLTSFLEHKRNNPFSKLYMWHAVANINSQDAYFLASYFSQLHPKAADDGNKKLIATGRAIYQEGIPSSNIVACVACHGPRAQGFREIPRLGGLSYAYLKRRLEQWHEGYDPYAKHPMPDVARRLSPNQISSLASYLSFISY